MSEDTQIRVLTAEEVRELPRDDHIVHMWQIEKLPLKEIGEKVGLSPERVRQILLAKGVQFPGRRRRSKVRLLDRDPVSKLHLQIGQDVVFHRARLGMSPTAFAEKVTLSTDRLRAIEMGVYQVTLSELTRICDFIGVPLSEIVKYRNMRALNS